MNIMQEKEQLLDDLGHALEELQRATRSLEIAKKLVEDKYSRLEDGCVALLINEAIYTNEAAMAFITYWPNRLEAYTA